MDRFLQLITWIDDQIWGMPLCILIIGCGVWLTIRVGFVQIRYLGRALKYMLQNEEGGKGEVSSFGALCTALSATIGTGNIVGVATAIAAGGPGALLWMVIAAFFGMATKYAEGLLAVKYRTIDKDGHVLGGPFYYIERGLGKNWKWLAMAFAFFGAAAGLLGTGTITQVNSITSAAQNFFDPDKTGILFYLGSAADPLPITVTTVAVGLVITIASALVLIGGIKRISSVSQIIVPFMALAYLAFLGILLFCNFSAVPGAIALIVTSAFSPQAALGGVLGATIREAIQAGVARGVFSNEAGLGSAPIAAAAAQTNEPARQGLVTMTSVFDTIIVCIVTGLAIVVTGAWDPALNLHGAEITTYAFQVGLPFSPQFSAFLLMICLIFFAFTTILGWEYYGERCLEYFTGGNKLAAKCYRWLYIAAVFVGPYLTVTVVWTVADICNALMALPNIIALLALSGVVAKESREYFARDSARHLARKKH